jgi:hypothetical protein
MAVAFLSLTSFRYYATNLKESTCFFFLLAPLISCFCMKLLFDFIDVGRAVKPGTYRVVSVNLIFLAHIS